MKCTHAPLSSSVRLVGRPLRAASVAVPVDRGCVTLGLRAEGATGATVEGATVEGATGATVEGATGATGATVEGATGATVISALIRLSGIPWARRTPSRGPFAFTGMPHAFRMPRRACERSVFDLPTLVGAAGLPSMSSPSPPPRESRPEQASRR
jgi:hypothetical protein